MAKYKDSLGARESRWVREYRSAVRAKDNGRIRKAHAVLRNIRYQLKSNKAKSDKAAMDAAVDDVDHYGLMTEAEKAELNADFRGMDQFGSDGSSPKPELYKMYNESADRMKREFGEYKPAKIEDYDLESGLGSAELLEKLGRMPDKRNRGGDSLKLNKFKALSGVYGSAQEVFNQMNKAGEAAKRGGLAFNMMPAAGDETVDVYRNDSSPLAAGYAGEDGETVPYIQTRAASHSRPVRFSPRMGYGARRKGLFYDNEGTLLHELTHVLEGKDKTPSGQFDWLLRRPADQSRLGEYDFKGDSVYGEYDSSEIFPALAAITRKHYKEKGKRITEGKEYDKLVSDYAAMSDEGKTKFVRGLSNEESRFYGYIDYLEGASKPIKVKAYGSPTKVIEAKDRLKRWHDNNRKFIPAVVKNDYPRSFVVDQMGVTGKA